MLIFKDIVNWLNDDGSFDDDLSKIISYHLKIATHPLFITSTRYINVNNSFVEAVRQLKISGMQNKDIAIIIKNNLLNNFNGKDAKNKYIANLLHGYPLGAKLVAYRISKDGYEHCTKQLARIKEINIGLAKKLISHARLSENCIVYLKVMAQCKSRLYNEEYKNAIPSLSSHILKSSDEAHFAGFTKFDDEGYYVLEPIVKDYFYELAFNDPKRKEICENIQKYLSKLLSKKSSIKLYMRLVPTCVHLLTLNGKIKESKEMRSELSQTMTSSMWDLYNHRDYDVAMNVSKKILEYESDNKEALYIKSLCLIRFNKLEEAYSIIKNLLKSNKNDARYFYAVGRIFKLKMNYEMAIKYFYDALEKKNSRYISAFRELAECYLCLGDTKKAIENVQKAKYIDNSNLFVILLEARILQKIGKLKEALEIVENLSRYEADPSLISFRKGRIYDEMGDINKAKEFYKESISFNKRSYDAKLCLLNIEIIDNNKDLEEEIFDLKSVLNGKKKYILLNIEARFYTYSKNDQEKTIEILNTVPELFRDRQWFAVMLQTLNNSKEEHLKSNRNILAQRADDKYRVVQNELQKRFGINNVYKSDFLPDI